MTFSDKLKELRKSKNITQEELANHIYVSRTAVSKWESNKGYPSIDTLRLLAEYFEVSIDELISNDEILKLSGDNLLYNKIKFNLCLGRFIGEIYARSYTFQAKIKG